ELTNERGLPTGAGALSERHRDRAAVFEVAQGLLEPGDFVLNRSHRTGSGRELRAVRRGSSSSRRRHGSRASAKLPEMVKNTARRSPKKLTEARLGAVRTPPCLNFHTDAG